MLREVGGWDALPHRHRRVRARRGLYSTRSGTSGSSTPRCATRSRRGWPCSGRSGRACSSLRGMLRLVRRDGRTFLAALLVLSVTPALGSHLLVHFGVPGYAFHYVPALIALVALGIGRVGERAGPGPAPGAGRGARRGILVLSGRLRPARPRGSFDLAFARQTRAGLRSPLPRRAPAYWRTANSQPYRARYLPPASRCAASAAIEDPAAAIQSPGSPRFLPGQ